MSAVRELWGMGAVRGLGGMGAVRGLVGMGAVRGLGGMYMYMYTQYSDSVNFQVLTITQRDQH